MKQITRPTLAAVLVSVATTALAAPALANSLHGSHASMVHQHAVAVKLDYSFARTPAQLKALVADSALEPVTSNSDLVLSGVSYPFARPAVREFVDWLAAEYHAATGSRLVVTSLARPTSRQPRNASPLSVHPAGMAVDLRIPANTAALDWLEQKLLSLEQTGVVDVTREQHPRHLHVAVFPEQYATYALQQAPVAPVAPQPADTVTPSPTAVAQPAKSAGDAAEARTSAAIAGGSLGVLLLAALVLATLRRAARQSQLVQRQTRSKL